MLVVPWKLLCCSLLTPYQPWDLHRPRLCGEQAETQTMAGDGHPQQASPGLWEDAPVVSRDGLMPSPQPGCPRPGATRRSWSSAAQSTGTRSGHQGGGFGYTHWTCSAKMHMKIAVLKSCKCFILLFRISTLLVSAVTSCPWQLQQCWLSPDA